MLAQPWAAPVLPQKLKEMCQSWTADALEWDISSGERSMSGSLGEADARDISMWDRVLASPFLHSTHFLPFSPLRFGHGQGTHTEPGQAGPEAAAQQQPVPVSAGAWGRGCTRGHLAWAGDCPTFGSSSSLSSPSLAHLIVLAARSGGCGFVGCPCPIPTVRLEHCLAAPMAAAVFAGSCPLCVAGRVWKFPLPHPKAPRRRAEPGGLHACRCWLQFWPLNAVLQETDRVTEGWHWPW